jgi:glycosyltransferase involved in cell wall biosynthesis
MITTFYPPYSFGGDAMFVQQLCHELARRGHHVEVIHCADAYRAVAGDEPCPGAPEPPGVTVHRLESPFGILSGLPILKSATIQRVLGQGFDVVHYHNMSLIGALRFRPRPAAVTLQTLHEYWLVCPTHMLFKYEREPCRAPRCVACTIAHRRPPQLWRSLGILRRAAAQVDVFITASRFAGDKHAELGFGRAIEILPPFTTRAPAPAPAAGWPPGSGPYFLFVGRLERVKGLQTLIPLFRRSTRARLLVAGTGSYEASLRRLAADAPNIAWLGHQSGDRLNQTCMVGPARDRPDVPASVRSSAVLGRGLRAPVRQPARAPA